MQIRAGANCEPAPALCGRGIPTLLNSGGETQAELAEHIENRVAAMSAAEREQFERLMKLRRPPTR